MPYGEAKVYFDGSHYIAIPHTERPTKPRKKPIEEEITIFTESEENEGSEVATPEPSNSFDNEQIEKDEQVIENEQIEPSEPKIERIITKKEMFEEFTDTLFAFVFHNYFSVLMNLLLMKVSSSVTRNMRNPIAQP